MKFSLDWDTPKRINKSNIMLISSLWVFLVPLIMKITDSTLVNLNSFQTFQLDIPVSFNILYFSGVSFFIGSLLFVFFCPSVIKEYASEKSFRNSAGSNSSLQYHIDSTDDSNSGKLIELLKLKIDESSAIDIDQNEVLFIEIGTDKHTFNFHKNKLNDVFSVFYYFSLGTRFKRLLLTFTFYFLGFLGIFYVFLNNFILILKNSF